MSASLSLSLSRAPSRAASHAASRATTPALEPAVRQLLERRRRHGAGATPAGYSGALSPPEDGAAASEAAGGPRSALRSYPLRASFSSIGSLGSPAAAAAGGGDGNAAAVRGAIRALSASKGPAPARGEGGPGGPRRCARAAPGASSASLQRPAAAPTCSPPASASPVTKPTTTTTLPLRPRPPRRPQHAAGPAHLVRSMNFEADALAGGDQSPGRLLRRSLPSPLRASMSAPLQLLPPLGLRLTASALGGSPGPADTCATGPGGGPAASTTSLRPGTPGADPELYHSDRACLVAEVEAQMRKSARLRAELQQAQVRRARHHTLHAAGRPGGGTTLIPAVPPASDAPAPAPPRPASAPRAGRRRRH
jgi:hypothetical protein